MGGVAGSKLAVAVTGAGGLGQIGFTGDPHLLDEELTSARRQLRNHKLANETGSGHVLPLGTGIIVVGTPVEEFISVISKHNPAVVWLSFGTAAEFQEWTTKIRQDSPLTKIWVQLGSVGAALEAARGCRPDALVLQGSDAGGHGHESGASIVSLIPEVCDAFRAGGLPDIPLIAAGGIMDGRGVAAALALGASGVVMGTRFLGAEEAKAPSQFRQAILEASDGGQSMARSRAFDAMWGPNPWPETYDGRCLKNSMYQSIKDGLSTEEARRKLYQDLRGQNVSPQDTMSIWAGTGVGMVKKVEKAADIVSQVRKAARETIMLLGMTVERSADED
ncbi:related to FMN-dependent 2-nitropropane dioxygenase [Cephalotrichum gorgonifer]|uniref:Related to FMN-dependent 2-nitropropane dioxygenase n=1 Tax=Cephalotrichum gorgonifer TaxID=2041049 RepID=A0AAE8SZY5_9PEZI|nr:related to FMN-dependent 2-nitropropane dioxygenase [Cephalotrichum gorgonifer]